MYTVVEVAQHSRADQRAGDDLSDRQHDREQLSQRERTVLHDLAECTADKNGIGTGGEKCQRKHDCDLQPGHWSAKVSA